MPTEIPVPFEERCEFLSDQYLDSAREFLQKRMAGLSGQLNDVSLLISENFDAPPPHLGLGDVACWTIELDRGRVSVARSDGPVESADFLIRADYDRVLPTAMTVYGDDPGLVETAQRESAHLLKGTAVERRGDVPPEALRLLGPLHDHLAKRTLNNTDLEHRIRQLGLGQNRSELDEKGYTVIHKAISSQLADELRAETRRLCMETPRKHYSAAGLPKRGRLFEMAAVQPHVLALAEHLLGRGFLLSQSIGLRRPAGLDTHPGLHADLPLVDEPFPELCLDATSIWALDDFEEDSGPTVLVPGSFRRRRHPPEDGDQSEAVPILLEKGSIAIWHGATWHGAKVREADGERITLHNSYGRVFTRTFDDFLNIAPAILERNSPAFTTLCGLDDLFQKNSLRGADLKKLSYAQQNAYGSQALRAGAANQRRSSAPLGRP